VLKLDHYIHWWCKA